MPQDVTTMRTVFCREAALGGRHLHVAPATLNEDGTSAAKHLEDKNVRDVDSLQEQAGSFD